jgi:protein-tyrosine phosphatase
LIDIHCHILPGIDDGASRMSDSLAMARLAADDGVRTIIATPHCHDGIYECQRHDIPAACERLNAVLIAKSVPLQVLPGAEIRLTPEFIEAFAAGRLLGLAGPGAVLLELPELFISEAVIRVIRHLQKKNVRCIVAHPERNSLLYSQDRLVSELVDAGAELQLTAGSLAGEFGSEAKAFSGRLLQSGATCYLASDGHCTRRRKPLLSKGLRLAEKLIGRERAANLVHFPLGDQGVAVSAGNV